MLLNEFLKEHYKRGAAASDDRRIKVQCRQPESHQHEAGCNHRTAAEGNRRPQCKPEEQAAQTQKLGAQLEVSKRTVQILVDN
jgi:hypothetical protein